jgi:hypothetical protein
MTIREKYEKAAQKLVTALLRSPKLLESPACLLTAKRACHSVWRTVD